jgi:hypothetical protein
VIHSAACALIVLVVAAPAAHGQETTVDVVDRTFARWMKEHAVARGTLAVAREDRLVLVKGWPEGNLYAPLGLR